MWITPQCHSCPCCMDRRQGTCGMEGTTHTIVQGEGGEQGVAVMPLLFALGQHQAVDAVQALLVEGEFVSAFQDDIYFVTVPEGTGTLKTLLQIVAHSRDSASIKGRRRCGTALGNNQLCAKFWIAWREQQIPQRQRRCGAGQTCPFHSNA